MNPWCTSKVSEYPGVHIIIIIIIRLFIEPPMPAEEEPLSCSIGQFKGTLVLNTVSKQMCVRLVQVGEVRVEGESEGVTLTALCANCVQCFRKEGADERKEIEALPDAGSKCYSTAVV